MTLARTNDWAVIIRADLQDAVNGLISAGQHLIEAKAELNRDGNGHGRWLPLLEAVGLHPRVAQQLMSVGANSAITNTNNYSHLPRAEASLYQLSRVPAEIVEAGIATGELHPKMTTKEVKQYIAPHLPARQRPAPPPPQPDPRDKALNEALVINHLNGVLGALTSGEAVKDYSTRAKELIAQSLREALEALGES